MIRSFRNGRMYVDGRLVRAQKRLRYQSISVPEKRHTTTYWEDGFVSCNCTGWSVHKKCWHTADTQVLSGYTAPQRSVQLPTRTALNPAVEIVEHKGQQFSRRMVDLED